MLANTAPIPPSDGSTYRQPVGSIVHEPGVVVDNRRSNLTVVSSGPLFISFAAIVAHIPGKFASDASFPMNFCLSLMLLVSRQVSCKAYYRFRLLQYGIWCPDCSQ
eukprot:GHVP01005093.1.p2 GENE.GHVP01005093.1~~GHVP01005093.1.p2  ORF type:complete len:106 (-),score=11.32 GHVP01005093.1:603-920(-)